MTTSKTTLDPELWAALKKLKRGKLSDTLPERLALAKKSKMSHEELLLLMLRDEIDRRDSTATARRASHVGLEPDMVLERWGERRRLGAKVPTCPHCGRVGTLNAHGWPRGYTEPASQPGRGGKNRVEHVLEGRRPRRASTVRGQ